MESLIKALIDQCCRVDSLRRQSGFLLEPGLVLTAAHGIGEVGAPCSVRFRDIETQGHVITRDPLVDIASLHIEPDIGSCEIQLGEPPQLGDRLYAWGFTEVEPDGESLTLEFEGYSTNPLRLKFKAGQVAPGFSGSPIVNLRTSEIIGLLVKTRDRRQALGGRGVPAAGILDYLGRAPNNPNTVKPEDLPNLLLLFDAAYSNTVPRPPVAPGTLETLETLADTWPELDDLLLLHPSAGATKRRQATTEWYAANPRVLRYIVDKHNTRAGGTCVLPLRSEAYRAVREGKTPEFALTAHDLVPAADGGGTSNYILFQSFVWTSQVERDTEDRLYAAIEAHVRMLATPGPIQVLAEIGTSAGARLARRFEMRPLGFSADARPLFERTVP